MTDLYIAGALIVWNLITFIVTVSDKKAAKKNRRRVPERKFLLFALLLGGAGVLAAFYGIRHKTRHIALLIQTWLLSLLSYAGACYAFIHFLRA